MNGEDIKNLKNDVFRDLDLLLPFFFGLLESPEKRDYFVNIVHRFFKLCGNINLLLKDDIKNDLLNYGGKNG